MQRIEIHISYSCVNKCFFCSEGSRLKRYKDFKIDFSQLKNILVEKRKNGFDHVTFTGGEPNMYANFLELLKLAKDLGYRIYVGSNGWFWADKDYLNKVLPFLDQVSLSLHGSNAKIHNLHTQQKESFSKIILSFANIAEYIKKQKKPYFMVNSSLTNYNLEDIINILNFVKQYGVKQVLISNISPEGTAYNNYLDLAVRYSKLKDFIPKWVDFANNNGLILRLFGLPLCVLNMLEVYSNDLSYDPRTTYALGQKDNKILLKERKTGLQRRRIYSQKCCFCRNKSLCRGIFSRYLELFGEQEIQAINF